MIKIKFPSGQTADELLHYMGADDEVNLKQRPLIAQQLIDKCHYGKECLLTREELNQLINEVENMLDIKNDHVGNGSWNQLQQYNLSKYLNKLRSL